MELYSPLLCGDLNEKEVPKRGDICITDSLCCKQKLTHKATILQKINIFFKKEQLENGTMYPSTPPHLSLASKTEVSFTHQKVRKSIFHVSSVTVHTCTHAHARTHTHTHTHTHSNTIGANGEIPQHSSLGETIFQDILHVPSGVFNEIKSQWSTVVMNPKTQSSLTFFSLKSFTPALWDHTSVELPTPKPVCQKRQWHPTLVLLPGESYGWRSLVGCSPWGR